MSWLDIILMLLVCYFVWRTVIRLLGKSLGLSNIQFGSVQNGIRILFSFIWRIAKFIFKVAWILLRWLLFLIVELLTTFWRALKELLILLKENFAPRGF